MPSITVIHASSLPWRGAGAFGSGSAGGAGGMTLRPKTNWVRAGKIDEARRVEGYGEWRRKRLEDEATRIIAGEQVNIERIGRRHMTEEEVQRLIGRRGKPRPPSKGTSV
jgi:hypothetical protein